MDESLYDEFGNYIGPELAGSDEVRVQPPSSITFSLVLHAGQKICVLHASCPAWPVQDLRSDLLPKELLLSP